MPPTSCSNCSLRGVSRSLRNSRSGPYTTTLVTTAVTTTYMTSHGCCSAARGPKFTRWNATINSDRISAEFPKRTVYHDSCYYGRYNDVYDEPRMLLSSAGAQVHEMERHHKFRSDLCGIPEADRIPRLLLLRPLQRRI